jgi:hypothetical protein
LEEDDKRILKDRRKHPTPGLSLYTFLGRRRKFRRKTDQERGGYTDRYSAGLFFILILIVGLNILDSFFTMIILDHGGWEVNPIVRCVIELYGDRFWVWKFFLVSISLLFMCLHSNFGRVRTLINCVAFIYFAVVLYQIFLITYRLPEIP